MEWQYVSLVISHLTLKFQMFTNLCCLLYAWSKKILFYSDCFPSYQGLSCETLVCNKLDPIDCSTYQKITCSVLIIGQYCPRLCNPICNSVTSPLPTSPPPSSSPLPTRLPCLTQLQCQNGGMWSDGETN
jgi:hypothetical protein